LISVEALRFSIFLA